MEERGQLTRLILWKPYMFNWRTKLENCEPLYKRVQARAESTHVVMFEVGAEDSAAELGDVRYDEAGAQFGPANKLGRLCVADHPTRRAFICDLAQDKRAYWYNLVTKLLVVIGLPITGICCTFGFMGSSSLLLPPSMGLPLMGFPYAMSMSSYTEPPGVWTSISLVSYMFSSSMVFAVKLLFLGMDFPSEDEDRLLVIGGLRV